MISATVVNFFLAIVSFSYSAVCLVVDELAKIRSRVFKRGNLPDALSDA